MTRYCSFFGHSNIYGKNLEKEIKAEVINCVNNGIYNFMLGGYGEFDLLCARVVRELKKEYSQIKSYLILAYLDKKYDDYDKQYIKQNFDDLIYPPLESVPKRLAILRRNKWIVDNSEFIIFYVTHLWGGAGKVFDYANKHNKNFVNLNSTKIV